MATFPLPSPSVFQPLPPEDRAALVTAALKADRLGAATHQVDQLFHKPFDAKEIQAIASAFLDDAFAHAEGERREHSLRFAMGLVGRVDPALPYLALNPKTGLREKSGLSLEGALKKLDPSIEVVYQAEPAYTPSSLMPYNYTTERTPAKEVPPHVVGRSLAPRNPYGFTTINGVYFDRVRGGALMSDQGLAPNITPFPDGRHRSSIG